MGKNGMPFQVRQMGALSFSQCPLQGAGLDPGAAWRNALLRAEQAKAGGHRVLGFRGRLLSVMHNSWAPVNIPAEAPQHHGKSQWGTVC